MKGQCWILGIIMVSMTNCQQMNIEPFLAFLRPENMRSVAELATELGSMAAKNVADNERDVQKTSFIPKPEETFKPEARPSQMIGGAISSLVGSGRNAFLDALDKLEEATSTPLIPTIPTMPTPAAPPSDNIFGIHPTTQAPSESVGGSVGGSRDVLGVRRFAQPAPKEIRYAQPVAPLPEEPAAAASAVKIADPEPLPLARPPPPQNGFDGSPFMQIARQFLGGGRDSAAGGSATNEPKGIAQMGIRDFIGGSDQNFGLPRGKGCLPFISEFMQIAYGNCQNVADEKTFDAWGEELRRAILTGEIDLLKASQETCRRGAERQQCDSLREAVANCDIMASMKIGSELQRNMKRCEEVSGMMDQSPAAVLGQLNNLISGEVAQGFLNNFLKNG